MTDFIGIAGEILFVSILSMEEFSSGFPYTSPTPGTAAGGAGFFAPLVRRK